MYKYSGIVDDDNWLQDVTESERTLTVREFLEVLIDQTKDNVNSENKIISITDKDIAETDDYNSDRFSEIDVNDHVEM